MSTLDSVLNPGISAEVDPTFRSLRVSVRPLEYETVAGQKVLGHYKINGISSAILAGASALLANFRWGDPTNFAVILRAYTWLTVVTAVTAQRTDPMQLSIARGYTINESTNATSLGFSGQSQKMRSSMGTTLVSASGQIAVASAAAGMSGGTRSNDAQPIGAAAFGAGGAIAALGTGMPVTDLYKWDKLGEHPIVLAQNEGLLLLWGATALATGTVAVGWGVDWAEVPAF